MISLRDFVAVAIRVPFVEKGRTYEGWDCWGLIRCAYKDVYNVNLPSYVGEYENTSEQRLLANIIAKQKAGDAWRQIGIKPGCIAVIYNMGQPTHMGLVISNYDIIHTQENIGTVIQSAKELPVEGYWVPRI